MPRTARSPATSPISSRDRPRVDAVLFNGGSLYPQPLRERICRQIGKWQGELAAARPGERRTRSRRRARRRATSASSCIARRQRIEAGAARAIFLEAHGKPSEDADANAGPLRSSAFFLAVPPPRRRSRSLISPCELRINRPVRFQTYSSTRHGSMRSRRRRRLERRGLPPAAAAGDGRESRRRGAQRDPAGRFPSP